MRVTKHAHATRLTRMTSDSVRDGAFHTTVDHLRDGRATIPVYSETEPNLTGLIEGERASTFKAVARGDYPVIRSGRRVRVAVPALLKMLDGE